MLIRSMTLASAVVLALLIPNPLRAQYLYMDSNGNGVHDSGDQLKKRGVTFVDIYLISNANRDGSVAVCNNEPSGATSPTPMQVFSFSLAFKAVGGIVSWGDFTTQTGFTFVYTAFTSDTEHHIFYAAYPGTPWLEPGKLYLGRLKVRVESGAPSLEFEPKICRPDGFCEETSFGTPCAAIDFDNTYQLGTDFHDVDGLAAPATSASGGSSVVVSPNPMNPAAKFVFETTRPGHVRIRLFDLRGRLVRTVTDISSMPAGRHELTLDGKNDRGRDLGSGVYFYRLESADGISMGRLTISR